MTTPKIVRIEHLGCVVELGCGGCEHYIIPADYISGDGCSLFNLNLSDIPDNVCVVCSMFKCRFCGNEATNIMSASRPDVAVDEDGCCKTCGVDAAGNGVEELRTKLTFCESECNKYLLAIKRHRDALRPNEGDVTKEDRVLWSVLDGKTL